MNHVNIFLNSFMIHILSLPASDLRGWGGGRGCISAHSSVYRSCGLKSTELKPPCKEVKGGGVTCSLRLYSKKNVVYGTPYAGVDYNSAILIVNSSQLSTPPLQRERGGLGRSLLPVLVEHIIICLLISKTTNRKGGRGEGEGRGES
jgi:hypothetical protein